MFQRLSFKFVLFVVVALVAISEQAFARQSITCTGGYLYIEQTTSDGEEICWETRLTCRGEWTYSWLKARPGDKSGPIAAIESSSARLSGDAAEKHQAAQQLSKARKEDMKLLYKAPATVVTSFKQRAGWPGRDKGPIVLPPDSPGPTFPEPPPEYMKAGKKGYPPHGYPCLGCKPCPPPDDAFCDIVWDKSSVSARTSTGGGLTQKDLSPEMVRQGYRVVDGKIVRVVKSPGQGSN